MDSLQPKRRRARKPDGSFKGDNPSTPGLNEAWEPTPIEAALPKEKYATKDMISSVSTNSAGKYSSKSKVTKPGLGKITTTYS
jgi:hypothetical protein